MEIPYEKQFHFRDGASVSSLDALKSALEGISYQEFYHHVNTQKNDFSNWVRYVLRDDQLADDLQKVTSIVETVEIINDYLHPRPITAQRTDQQSRIEADIFSTPLPLETGQAAVVEQVPTVSPSIPRVEEPPSLDQLREVQDGVAMSGKTREELFGPGQSSGQSSYDINPPSQPPTSVGQGRADAASSASADSMRLIVKDFMYGLVFGLIIGLILGRIIS